MFRTPAIAIMLGGTFIAAGGSFAAQDTSQIPSRKTTATGITITPQSTSRGTNPQATWASSMSTSMPPRWKA